MSIHACIHPDNPGRHGDFLAEAYAVSNDLGILAGSYVLQHYYSHRDILRTPHPALSTKRAEHLGYLAGGVDIRKISGRSDAAICRTSSRLYAHMGVHGMMAAVRSGIEHGPLTVPALGGTAESPPDFAPYELVVADLLSRGVGTAMASRLTGYNPTALRGPLNRVLGKLSAATHQKGLAIQRLYACRVFRQGVLNDESLVAEIFARFDKDFGRNVPF